MSAPAIAGNAPEPGPRAVQPAPMEMLETRIAAPNDPVSAATKTSSARRETMCASAAREPALFRADLAGALDVGRHELLEVGAGDEHARLLRALQVLLPLRRGLHLLHEVHVEVTLLGFHARGKPRGARLLVERDVEARLGARGNVVPSLRRADLRALGEALRVEEAERPLRAGLPLAQALAGVVGVGSHVAARELHCGFRPALERDVRELHAGHLLDEVR